MHYFSDQPDSTMEVFDTLLGSTAARTASIFVHPRQLLACAELQAGVSPPCRIRIVECISILDQLGKMHVLPHDAPREPLDWSTMQRSWQVSWSVLYCQRPEEGSCNASRRAAPRNRTGAPEQSRNVYYSTVNKNGHPVVPGMFFWQPSNTQRKMICFYAII